MKWCLRAPAVVVAGFVLVTAVLGGCGGGGEPEDGSAAAQFRVGTRRDTFVDASRGTDAQGAEPAMMTRTLETLTYYPAVGEAGGEAASEVTEGALPASAEGPFPLIVFSHGNGVPTPARYDLLFRSWASSGYVVAAPRFPLSSMPDGGDDVVNQPGDVSFVITELLSLNAGGTSAFARLIDPQQIAVAGHSLGGVTTLGVAFNRCCLDQRIKAGVVLAGRSDAFPQEGFFDGIDTPILVVHGEDDRLVRLAEGEAVFEEASPPKVMLTVLRGDHNRPFGPDSQGRGQPNDGTSAVIATTTHFFDRYLKGQGDALDRLRDHLADNAFARLDIVEA